MTITATSVGAGVDDDFFGSGGSLSYVGLAELNLELGSGGNAAQVAGTHAGVTDIVGGDGDDEIIVAGTSTGTSKTRKGTKTQVVEEPGVSLIILAPSLAPRIILNT